ncbi:MAG: GNAT family N-acetyltransferase [Bacteroidota bacterium]
MDTFPKIETDRLILGRLFVKDIPNIIAYAGNRKIAANTLNVPHPYGEKDAIFWMNSVNQGFEHKTQFSFGIRIKTKGEFIGGVGLKVNTRFQRAELGYWIAEPFWNQGYASEAVKAILKFGFQEINLNKIYATHLIENPASGNVMIKNGMIKEAELKEHVKKDGVFKSLIQYRMTKQEFENRNSV